MSATSNVHQVIVAMRDQGEGLQAALVAELSRQASEATAFMRQRAPKFRSALTESINRHQISETEWEVRPAVEYSRAVEEGRRPGKGLPRWSDPGAADIKAWLTSKAFAGRRRARRNSPGAKREAQELRDRYQGLAWHVRHHGIRPHPYVRPTAEMMRVQFSRRMELAARRYLAANGGTA